MPLFLIKIERSKWFRDAVPWLKEGELQADALWNLRCQANAVSVWHVEHAESNLKRLVAALAGPRDSFSNLDCVLIDQAVISMLEIKVDKSDGKSCDTFANANWHFDLVELTASKVFALAKALKDKGKFMRFQEWDVKKFLVAGLKSGEVCFERLSPRLQARLSVEVGKAPEV